MAIMRLAQFSCCVGGAFSCIGVCGCWNTCTPCLSLPRPLYYTSCGVNCKRFSSVCLLSPPNPDGGAVPARIAGTSPASRRSAQTRLFNGCKPGLSVGGEAARPKERQAARGSTTCPASWGRRRTHTADYVGRHTPLQGRVASVCLMLFPCFGSVLRRKPGQNTGVLGPQGIMAHPNAPSSLGYFG